MSAYLIVSISVTDPERFALYRAAAPDVIAAYGGRYLVRGGEVETLEGAYDGRRIVILEFPSTDALHAFWNSPDYARVKTMRAGAAEFDVLAIQGVKGTGNQI